MRQVTVTKQQAQKIGMKSAFLNTKCTGRVGVTKQYSGVAKPAKIARTKSTKL